MIMIVPCTQFYFQPPYLDPTHTVLILELIDGNGGGEQPLVGSGEQKPRQWYVSMYGQ
jgi:hypothetical protein